MASHVLQLIFITPCLLEMQDPIDGFQTGSRALIKHLVEDCLSSNLLTGKYGMDENEVKSPLNELLGWI